MRLGINRRSFFKLVATLPISKIYNCDKSNEMSNHSRFHVLSGTSMITPQIYGQLAILTHLNAIKKHDRQY